MFISVVFIQLDYSSWLAGISRDSRSSLRGIVSQVIATALFLFVGLYFENELPHDLNPF